MQSEQPDFMDPELAEIADGMTAQEMRELAAELERRARIMLLPYVFPAVFPTRACAPGIPIYRQRFLPLD
jgi:hypothetical protein